MTWPCSEPHPPWGEGSPESVLLACCLLSSLRRRLLREWLPEGGPAVGAPESASGSLGLAAVLIALKCTWETPESMRSQRSFPFESRGQPAQRGAVTGRADRGRRWGGSRRVKKVKNRRSALRDLQAPVGCSEGSFRRLHHCSGPVAPADQGLSLQERGACSCHGNLLPLCLPSSPIFCSDC